MNDPRAQHGVVAAIGHDTGPGDRVEVTTGYVEDEAPKILYRIKANTPNGIATYEWVKPSHGRPLPPPFAIRSAPVGSVCAILWFGNEAYFLIPETLPTPVICGEGAELSTISPLLEASRFRAARGGTIA